MISFVIFSVLDRNDNKPIFSQQSYTFTGKVVMMIITRSSYDHDFEKHDDQNTIIIWSWHGLHGGHMIMILKSMIAYIAVPETEPAGQTVFTGVSLDDKDTGTNSQVIMEQKI